MKIFRRVVFLLFSAVFVVGTPKIIFYVLGYSFQPGVERGIVQSGLIFLSTAPPGAEIYVNGRRYGEPTPAIVSDLAPGDYSVRLLLKDHYPWARSIPVHAGKATVLGNILLRPKKAKWKNHIAQSYERLIPISGTHDLILWDGRNKVEVYDWALKKKNALFQSPEIHWRSIQRLIVSPESSAVIAIGQHDEKIRARWSKIAGSESWIPLPPEWRHFKVDDVMWDNRDERYLFGIRDGEVKRIDLYQKTAQHFLSDVRGLAVDNRNIFYLTGSDFLSMDVTGKSPRAIWNDADNFLGKEDNVRITPVSPERAFFLTPEGKFATNDPPRLISEKGIRGSAYDKKNQAVLYWDEKSLMAAEWVSVKSPKGEPIFEIKKRTLFSGARDIQTAFWAHDGAYVVYQDQNKVFLLEPQSFGAPFVYELFEVRRGSTVFFSEESGLVFYLDKNDGYLMSLELIPKWKVMEVPFAMIHEKVKELET